MEQQRVIEPCVSPWCAPVVVVAKKSGKVRICSGYRRLNAVTRRDLYPLPKIEDLFAALNHAVIFTTLDAFAGF